jgi:intracellular sulfur oxidation DsrE/DsrF family protein
MKPLLTIILLTIGLSLSNAQDKLFPVIKGYGAIEVVPFETVKPDPNQTYKLIDELYFGQEDKEKLYSNLNYSARIVNGHAATGIPQENLKMAIVIFSGATPTILSNAEYKKRFGFDNSNIEVLDRLMAAGVDVIVCGQSLVKQKITPDLVHKGVTQAFSRITATSDLINQGYSIF